MEFEPGEQYRVEKYEHSIGIYFRNAPGVYQVSPHLSKIKGINNIAWCIMPSNGVYLVTIRGNGDSMSEAVAKIPDFLNPNYLDISKSWTGDVTSQMKAVTAFGRAVVGAVRTSFQLLNSLVNAPAAPR